MIDLQLISSEQWKKARETQPSKWNNAHHIDTFNKTLVKFKSDFNGTIEYFKSAQTPRSYDPTRLQYVENTPIFNFFKLAPSGYYMSIWEPNELWKRCDTDSSILSVYNKPDKYARKGETFDPEFSYIAFPLQSNAQHANHSFNIEKFVQVVMWAENNNKHVVFKLHPHTDNNSHIIRYWNELKKRGVARNYTHMIGADYDTNIFMEKSTKVWTFSSGAGFRAAVMGKPVATFWKHTDFQPISTFVTSPEQADNIQRCEDLLRFLTWYYNLVLDTTDSAFESRLYERLEAFLYDRKTIDQVF